VRGSGEVRKGHEERVRLIVVNLPTLTTDNEISDAHPIYAVY